MVPNNQFNSYIESIDLKWTPYDNLIRYLTLAHYSGDTIDLVLKKVFDLPPVPYKHLEELMKNAENYKERFEDWHEIYRKHYKMFLHRSLRNLLIATISAGESPERITKFIKSKSKIEISGEEIKGIKELFWNIDRINAFHLAIFLDFLSLSDPRLKNIVDRALARYDLESLYIELDIIPTDDVDVISMAKALLKKAFYSLMQSRTSLDAQRYAEIISQAAAIVMSQEDAGEDLRKVFEMLPAIGHQKPKVEVNEDLQSTEIETLKEKEVELVPQDPQRPLETLPKAEKGSSFDIRIGETGDDDVEIEKLFPDYDLWE